MKTIFLISILFIIISCGRSINHKDLKVTDVRSFSEDYAAVQVDGKWGFINKSGKFIVVPKFVYAYDFHEGLDLVQLKNRWGYIDKTGKMVI